MPDMEQIELNGVVYDVRDPTKAPAGYGLGTTGQMTNDWNTAVKSGLFYGNKNSPDGGGWNGIVSAESANYCTQLLFKSVSNNTCIRHMNNGTWGEWEWNNPPMALGVEYRTTERHNGKAVYAKAIDFGALPNATEKQVEFCAEGATAVSDLKLHLSDGYLLSAGYGIDKMAQISNGLNLGNTPTKVRVHAEGNYSNLTAYATIKYTKD